MGVKSKDMIKHVFGAGDLTLTPLVGQSILVKRVFGYAVADHYGTLKIDKTTVGYFRVDQTYGNHLMFPQGVDTVNAVTFQKKENLLDFLAEKSIFKGYPVAEGQTFTLTGLANAADFKAVIYDVYDAADIKSTDENGSQAAKYMFIGYGNTGAAIATAGDWIYNTALNPVEFPKFPFGVTVPAKKKITVYGICGSEVAVVNATPALAVYTQFLKMVKEREVLFDPDRNGFLFDFSKATVTAGIRMAGGQSLIGNYSHIDPRQPFMFADPLLFDSGEELNVYVTTAMPVAASNIPLLNQVIGLIMSVESTG